MHQAAKVQLEASEWVIPEDLERFFSRFSAIRDIGPVVPTPGGNASRGVTDCDLVLLVSRVECRWGKSPGGTWPPGVAGVRNE